VATAKYWGRYGDRPTVWPVHLWIIPYGVRFLVPSIETLLIQMYYRHRRQNQKPKNKEQENSPPPSTPSLFVLHRQGALRLRTTLGWEGEIDLFWGGKQPKLENRKHEGINELRFILKEFD
jgi:hypothetical protein